MSDGTASSRTSREICADLEALSHEPGYLYSLAVLLRRDLFLDPADAIEVDWKSRLSYQEFSFVAGLMIKRPIDLGYPSDAATVSRQAYSTYELFTELHDTHKKAWLDLLVQAVDETDASSDAARRARAEEFFGSGAVMTEAIFYSSSGAFDFQYWDLAPTRYELDAPWLESNRGLTIERVASTVSALKDFELSSLPADPNNVTFNELCEALLDIFCVSEADIRAHAGDETAAMLSAFSVEPGTANAGLAAPGDYNAVESHPFVHLSDGRYFIPVHFNLSRSLYESPLYWMLADPDYIDTAAEHRGSSTETITAGMLESVFGPERVHRGVLLRRGKAIVGEIDVLATLGSKALIVQCKSKRLTLLARRGDTEQLKIDFNAAVQSAYDQALLCRELLNADGIRVETREGAVLDVSDVNDAYIACVVSDHYPSLSHQVHTFLTKSSDDPYPIALSLFDLDLVTFYLSNPFDLMYYVRQRVDLAGKYRADEEAALLAYHLKHKLFDQEAADQILIDQGLAQYIDANFPVAKGHHPRTDATDLLFHEWRNEDFDDLMAQIQEIHVPTAVDAAFLWMDLSGETVDELLRLMHEVQNKTRQDGQKHSLATTITGRDAGVSYVAIPEGLEPLELSVHAFAEVKKYATKSGEWMGLGATAESAQLIDVITFNTEPWSADLELEQLAAQLLKPGTMRSFPKQGRNELCSCGSGLKHKHCHGRS